MAQFLQQFMFLVAFVFLYNFFACQQVQGIAVRLSEAEEVAVDTTTSKLTRVEGNKFLTENGTLIEMFPVSEPHLKLQLNNTRRQLGDYLSCSTCKCCDSTGTQCLSSTPCCFTINCNVQPFGYCKFVPVTCDCQKCGS